jgi:hypothetical protein
MNKALTLLCHTTFELPPYYEGESFADPKADASILVVPLFKGLAALKLFVEKAEHQNKEKLDEMKVIFNALIAEALNVTKGAHKYLTSAVASFFSALELPHEYLQIAPEGSPYSFVIAFFKNSPASILGKHFSSIISKAIQMKSELNALP